MPGSDLYALFCSLHSGGHAGLLQQIVQGLPGPDQRALRAANKHLQRVMSDVVSGVKCAINGPRFERDLAEVFPAATVLRVDLKGHGPSTTTTAAEACIFLHCIAADNPKLLKRATRLAMDLQGLDLSAADVQLAVLRFLSRCASLDQLTIQWNSKLLRDMVCGVEFLGPGVTPDKCRESMQRQLADIVSDTAFLAPASWPTAHCLASLALVLAPNTPLHRQYLRAAFATTSLVSIAAHCAAPDDLLGSQALSALTGLTQLAITSAVPAAQAAQREFAAVLPRLTSLASLCLHGDVLASAGVAGVAGAASLPKTWSRLKRLTYLAFESCTLSLSHLPQLPALRELDLAASSTTGSLAHLASLTALTCIRDGTALDADQPEPDEDEAGDADVVLLEGAPQLAATLASAAAVPQQWRQSLRDLEWGFRRADIPLLAHLHSLTRLELISAILCPKLCCDLAHVPNLASLALPDASIRPGSQRAPHAASRAFRPLLPALRNLWVFEAERKGGANLLHLASWTDVPATLQVDFSYVSAGAFDAGTPRYSKLLHLEYTSWGAGWLPAVLNHASHASGVALVLDSDPAVLDLLRALRREGPVPGTPKNDVVLVLGTAVTSGMFPRLMEAVRLLPSGRLHVAAKDEHAALVGPVPQALFDRLPGLRAAGLRELVLDNCSAMRDAHVAAIVAGAPDIGKVKLLRAGLLTDHSLYVLVGCRELTSVTVTHSRAFTAEAAAVLLTTAPRLVQLDVPGLDPAALLEQLKVLQWARVVPPARAWTVSRDGVSSSGNGRSSMLRCSLKES